MKITILGAGEVGSHVGLFCVLMQLGDIYLFDKDYKKAEGQASDINQALSALKFDNEVYGGYDHTLIKDADIVVVAVGQRRKGEMKRIDLYNINKKDVKECSNQIRKYAPNSTVIVVTNPVDEMTEMVLKHTRFPHERVIKFGNLLDTARFRQAIHRQTGIPRSKIECKVTGYHNEEATHFFDGDVDTNESRFMAIDTINKKGSTVFAPAICITEIIRGYVLR